MHERIIFTWQNAWPWKNRTFATHITMKRKIWQVSLAKKKTITTSSLYMQFEPLIILQNDIETKISFTWIIKVMIPQMISCTTEKKYYDFRTDLKGLWFLRWCYVAWGHHDNDSSKSKFGVMIPQMVLSNLKTSGLWFVCLTESYDDTIKPEQIALWFLKHIQLSLELSQVIQYPNFLIF